MLANPNRMPGNLPSRPTRFIGHAGEVGRLIAALDETPVVTLTGAGGVGKTRTAIELAKRTSTYFPDGVWFVNLALLDDGADVVPFVCETLRDVAPMAHDAASFAAALGDRQVLLLFDSCEHVLEQTAVLVTSIVEAAPRARVIATSRQPLGAPRELEHRLNTLSLDDAAELFYDRACNVGIELGEFERPVIATIVEYLDGIPLAIELAAPLLRTMSTEELLRHFDDRLELLSMENSGAPSRQQTLEAMHDWSHRLLSENAQKLFRRLAIFVGGCTLEAAMHVCADEDFNEARLSEALDELVLKSLVIKETFDGRSRYRMLEITRTYAQSCLLRSNEYDEAAQAHVRYFALLTRRFEGMLDAMPILQWQAMVTGEAQNFRAALSLALDAGDVDGPAEICEALHHWLWTHGPVHAADLTRRIATILETTMEARVEAPLRLALAALLRRTARPRALEAAKRAYDLYRSLGDVVHLADGLRATSSLQHAVLGAPAAQLTAEVARLANLMLEMGSVLRAAELLNNLGVAYAEMLDDARLQDASICFERAAGLMEARGDRARAGVVMGNSAITAFLSGDTEQAVRWSERATGLFDQVPDSIEAGHQWSNFGFHLSVVGRFEESRTALRKGIEIALERNDREGLSEVLENSAYFYHVTGEDRLAARLIGCAQTLLPRDLARQARDGAVLQEILDSLRANLGDDVYEEERASGAAIPLAEILHEAERSVLVRH
ncbi:MAG TPA: NB-ARC domain-containing protein [Candidatus Baltobacteraceae bacterium]|nr:NB-ARC domain-containing protein [Candidatus Baltobacteraceae bacterium]